MRSSQREYVKDERVVVLAGARKPEQTQRRLWFTKRFWVIFVTLVTS